MEKALTAAKAVAKGRWWEVLPMTRTASSVEAAAVRHRRQILATSVLFDAEAAAVDAHPRPRAPAPALARRAAVAKVVAEVVGARPCAPVPGAGKWGGRACGFALSKQNVPCAIMEKLSLVLIALPCI